MASPTRAQVLSLYGNLLRASNSFYSYNFREYFVRNTRQRFRAHQSEADSARIKALYEDGLRELNVIRQAAAMNRLYAGPRLVVEKSGTPPSPYEGGKAGEGGGDAS
ncbi:hypothetical protein BOTBODRAFT_166958 [Botryobasidium botryosum FD-172 SS1]|uniref:Complex 1 LYR protein domain-containing protein n=1 Tax=Botryobasidium botryosum (strain FD-172 SS1) TaxID=930990 RepID=A0A067LWI9_BOTB1|nr:hypothetical protein BOTBODRAFT_166958 [Botryobasidium botryosum FD-172 SS1]